MDANVSIEARDRMRLEDFVGMRRDLQLQPNVCRNCRMDGSYIG
jgi:hypothetical protein